MEITISLRPELLPLIEAEARRSGQAIAEFLAKLVEDAVAEPYDEELERLLQEGLDSGEPVEVTPEFWRQLRADLTAKYETAQESR